MTIVICIFIRREGRTYINITSASTSITGRGLSLSFAMILPLLMVLMTPSSTTTALCDRRVILTHAHFVGFWRISTVASSSIPEGPFVITIVLIISYIVSFLLWWMTILISNVTFRNSVMWRSKFHTHLPVVVVDHRWNDRSLMCGHTRWRSTASSRRSSGAAMLRPATSFSLRRC